MCVHFTGSVLYSSSLIASYTILDSAGQSIIIITNINIHQYLAQGNVRFKLSNLNK